MTNLVPPYREPVFELMKAELERFEVWVDARTEFNRFWETRPLPAYVRHVPAIAIGHSVQRPGGSEPHSTYISLGAFGRLFWVRPSVVVSSELGARSVFAAIYAGALRRRLVLWLALTKRTEAGYGRVRTIVRRLLLRRCGAVLVHSASAAEYVRQLAPGGRVVVHPQTSRGIGAIPEAPGPGSAPASFSPERPLSLLIVSQLIPRKHLTEALGYLAEALPPEHHVHVRVVGSGPEEPRLRQLSVSAPPHLRITLEGYVAPHLVGSFYRGADALLFPTLHDDWGLVVNEALAHGLPVIGSDGAGAVAELVRPGLEGFRHGAGDDREMVTCIRRFYEADRESRTRMRAQCSSTATRLGSEGLARALVSLVSGP